MMYEADESNYPTKSDESTEILRPAYKILSRLVRLWDEMGIDEHQRDNRLKRAQEMVVNLLQDLVIEEEETKKMVLKRIDDLKHRIRDLTSELELIDSPITEASSMVKHEKMLHSRVTQLREMRQKRMSQFEDLRSQAVSLGKRLGQRPSTLTIGSDRLPTELEIDRLSDRVASLNNEKESRLIEAQDLSERLQGYIRELDVSMPEEFKEWPRFDDVVNFEMNCPLTASALAKLREVTERFRQRRDTAEIRYEELLDQVEQLWSRLGTSECDKSIFLQQLPKSKPACLHQMEDEVNRLIAMKRANMERFMEECRAELRQWWERCFIPLDEQNFCQMNEEDEDLTVQLESLENEVSRLKRYFQENEDGFQKVMEWNSAFEKLKITECKLKDPSVLSNRGGVLLKYEKAKRATQRQMQALETSLGTFIALKIEGQPVLAYIEDRRLGYEEEKENEKRERQEKHSNLLHKEMRYGSKPVVTPGKKRFLSCTLRQVNSTCVTSIDSPKQPKLRKMETAASQFRKKLTACDSITPSSPLTPQPSPSRPLFRTPGTVPRTKNSSPRVSLARRRSRAIASAAATTSTRPGLVAATRTPKRANVTNLTRSTTYSEFAHDVHSKAARSSIGKSSSKSSQCSSKKTIRL